MRKAKPQGQPQKHKKSPSRIILIIVCIFVFLASAAAVLYPLVAEYVASMEKSQVRTVYEEQLNAIDTSELDAIRAEAQRYNTALSHISAFSKEEIAAISDSYADLLNISGNGIMGYIDIPIIHCYLPIYHGDDPTALTRGVEHLYGTSLPVGGDDTHAVLSGHTGMAGEKMFTDLESLETGDIFYLHVLNETLAYQVDQVMVVKPTEVDEILIVPGEDYVTLITCTPYAVNTHRLLVRGTRIPYEEAAAIEEQIEEVKSVESNWNKQYITGILYGVAILAVIILLFFAGRLIARKLKGKKLCKGKKEKEE